MIGTRVHFNSLDEYCNVPVNPVNARYCTEANLRANSRSERAGWLGTMDGASSTAASFDVARDRVQKGWPAGAQRVNENLAQLDIAAPMSVRRKLVRADQGDELDIHAVNRGDLGTAWTSRKRKHSAAKLTVRLVVQTNLLARMSAEGLFWRGATAVKFIDILTEAGYNVEVVGVCASVSVTGHRGTFCASFPLKGAAEPLDVEMMAGVVCNAGFHRIFGFRAYVATATAQSRFGAATSCTNGNVVEEAQFDADGVRTFRVPYAVDSKYAAEQWLAANVAALDAATHE